MPTKDNLHDIWSSQFQLFGGHAMPQQAFIGETDGHGLAEQRFTDTPANRNRTKRFTGAILGTVEFNSATEELSITLNSPKVEYP